MKNWDKLPNNIRYDEVKPFYLILKRKRFYRFVKRIFDIFASFILIVLLFVPSVFIILLIVFSSKGGPFFCQERIGRYGKPFKIIKFRSMFKNSEGDKQITSNNDSRVTKPGKFLRKTHIDEFPQLLNVIIGQMSFVGTRPEVKKYVDLYEKEWNATLLMRPGITSTASYTCDDEAKLMSNENAHEIYIKKVLPHKMTYNLNDLKSVSFCRDFVILCKTIFRSKHHDF